MRKRYIIERAIGRGGMAAIYKAKDTRHSTSCAIKEMSLASVSANERPQALENFLIEARILSRLNHPNLPAFTDFFTEGTRHFLVMEYIDGSNLEELLEANRGPFSERRVLGWARQLCDVLEYLHNQQPPIIFRDLKPGNIMLTHGGRIKLIDFGIARFFGSSSLRDTQLLQPLPVKKTKIKLLRAYRVFLCYAREDEKLLDQLGKHLKALQRQHYIEPWYDRDINAGSDWRKDIDEHLKTADIILLLVSPDFMASDYCYGVEVEKAMDRHNNGEAIVIPVILRHTYWNGALFGDLQALPEDAKPIFGPDYPYPDKAFFEVIEGVLEAIKYLEYKSVSDDNKKESTPYGDIYRAEREEQRDLDTQKVEQQKRHIWGEEKK